MEATLPTGVREYVLGSLVENESIGFELKAFWYLLEMSALDISRQIYQFTCVGPTAEQTYKQLERSIHRYVPKHVAVWGNIGEDALLVLGCSDNCFVTGIPSLTPLIQSKIDSMVAKAVDQGLRSRNTNLHDMVSVSIHKASIDELLLPKPGVLDEEIATFHKNVLKINEEKLEYRSRFRSWLNAVQRYREKISIALNTPSFRAELADWIRSQIESKPHLVGNTDNIVEQLMGDSVILVTDEILVQKRIGEARHDRDLLKYTFQYRDVMVDRLMLSRPTKPIDHDITLMAVKLSGHVAFARKFVEQGASFYVLEIKIRGDLAKHRDIEYLQDGQWVWRERCQTGCGPGCKGRSKN